MSGVFGNLSSTGTDMLASYFDPYISLDPTTPNYIGNLSFNIHFANFSVLACGKYSSCCFRGELTDSIEIHNAGSPSSAGTSSSTQAPTAYSGAISHSVGTLLLAMVGISVAICLS